MIAYHGRQELKDAVLSGLAEHRRADRIVQGIYALIGSAVLDSIASLTDMEA